MQLAALFLGMFLIPATSVLADASASSKIVMLDLTLTPTHAPSGIADGMAVAYSFAPSPASKAPLTLKLDTLEPGLERSTDVVSDLVVAHEMVHSLARYLEKEREDGDWYTEGIANYLAITVPNAAGLYTASQYLDLVNAESAGYYTNAQRSAPNDKLASIVWSGRNAWSLPYKRGSMYFADLDAKLRTHDAKVTVLDLVNQVSERINAGEPADRHMA